MPHFTRNPHLIYTANGKYVDAIPHLLGHGPDVYARDLDGTTALDLARASRQDRHLPHPRKKLRADPVPRPWALHRHFEFDPVNRRMHQILFGPEVPFSCLDKCMAEQHLNLFQLATSCPA